MIPAAPSKPPPASYITTAQQCRRRFRGHHHEKKCQNLVDVRSESSSISSGWLYTGPEFEAQAAPSGLAYSSQNGYARGSYDRATVEAKDEPQQGGGNSRSCIPSSLLAEMKTNVSLLSARPDASPGWGCFRPVVLPSEVSFTSSAFHKDSEGQQGGGGGGGGRIYRFDVSPRLGKQAPAGSPRARAQAAELSGAIQTILYGVRSGSFRPGRKKLAEATARSAADKESSVLRVGSGAQRGLKILSALEDIVADEGEVFEACFRELVRQERSACRQRGELLEVMRGHYASLFKEVVEHLSKLKESLADTVGEEKRLKQQAYCVQRLSKLLAEDAKINEDHRRKIASLPSTELERYISARDRPKTAAGGEGNVIQTAATAIDAVGDEEDGSGRRISSSSGSAKSVDSAGGRRAQSQSAESLAGLLSEVRSDSRPHTRNSIEQTDRTRHMIASVKVDILQEMIDERVAEIRERERRENWRRYKAATTIRNWWRKVHPPEWEEADRQYAATLIQACVRGMIARGIRKRMLEQFRATRGAIALQSMYRRYLAMRERRRRARVVELALGAGLRVLGRAVADLEARVSAPINSAEEKEKKAALKLSVHKSAAPVAAGGQRKGAKAAVGIAGEEPAPSLRPISTEKPSVVAENPSDLQKTGLEKDAAVVIVVDRGAASGAVGSKPREESVPALVERLKALGDLWEHRIRRNVVEELGEEDERVDRLQSNASSTGGGLRKQAARRRRP